MALTEIINEQSMTFFVATITSARGNRIMNRVQTKIPPHLAEMLNAPSSGWLIIENEIAEGATVGDLLGDLVSSYTGFRQAIFNPAAGEVSEQVLIILNDNLLQGPDVINTRLNDGDSITLLTVYSGG